MVKLTHLHCSIRQQKILDDVSMEAKKGEVTVILGPSGAGKSTLLRCINYLAAPQRGQLTIGQDQTAIEMASITKQQIRYLRSNVGMVFQHYHLFHHKTVLENIAECLRIVHGHSRKDARDIALDSLEQVRLSDKINEYPQRLSGGQKQRVSIARALAIQPKVILFDEPTSALDHDLVAEVQAAIKDLANKGITMIIVTHELQFAKCIANQVLVMDSGKIVSRGDVSELFDYAQL